MSESHCRGRAPDNRPYRTVSTRADNAGRYDGARRVPVAEQYLQVGPARARLAAD